MPSAKIRLKKTVSVTVAPELYQQARQVGLNLSAVLTRALTSELKAIESERWKRENKAGMEELNRITNEHGLLSDKYKVF
ncbi:antitoxin [Photorhabdus luminescens]|nr:antitoxin [Photorhabdus luminescens]